MKRMALVVIVLIFQDSTVPANELESWYFYGGLGYADITYPGALDYQMEQVADLPGVSHTSITLDLPGVYWPRDDKTLTGVIVNSFGDRYEEGGEWIQLNGYLLSLSTMYFPKQIGDGFFTRADAGLTWYVMDSSVGLEDTSDKGFGILFGGGYGIPVASGTRILLNINYAMRRVNDENTNTLNISLGGLF